tara:strand:+ start:561 stop:680 length:120 start_codon:yes stop_codon:yes gene_type:complete
MPDGRSETLIAICLQSIALIEKLTVNIAYFAIGRLAENL